MFETSSPSDPESEGSSTFYYIGGGVGGLIALIVLIFIIRFLTKRYSIKLFLWIPCRRKRGSSPTGTLMKGQSIRSFKANQAIINQARQTAEVTSNLAKIIAKPKPSQSQQFPEYAKKAAKVTVGMENNIRNKVGFVKPH